MVKYNDQMDAQWLWTLNVTTANLVLKDASAVLLMVSHKSFPKRMKTNK